jgi:hypothetical protein
VEAEYTTDELALLLGLSQRQVRRQAEKYRLGRRIGKGALIVLNHEDASFIASRVGMRGRPRKKED